MAKRYWLFKSEPDCFSIDDLKKKVVAPWDGVRNFQARNFLRDDVALGDEVLFYHSSCKEPAAVGVANVAQTGYPDYTAWEKGHEHFDARSTEDNPLWYMVDVAYVHTFLRAVTLREMKQDPGLSGMRLLERGNRLSVMPVSASQFSHILALGKGSL